MDVSQEEPVVVDQGTALLALYDTSLGEVYGYLRRRCPDTQTAEDLTSETFLAAVDAVRRRTVRTVTVGWLIGIARHKLVDHWRRGEREERRLALVEVDALDETWDDVLEAGAAGQALDELNTHYRAALTFRYLDDLPVREVARLIGRGEQATEALLARARIAFRCAYEMATQEVDGHDR